MALHRRSNPQSQTRLARSPPTTSSKPLHHPMSLRLFSAFLALTLAVSGCLLLSQDTIHSVAANGGASAASAASATSEIYFHNMHRVTRKMLEDPSPSSTSSSSSSSTSSSNHSMIPWSLPSHASPLVTRNDDSSGSTGSASTCFSRPGATYVFFKGSSSHRGTVDISQVASALPMNQKSLLPLDESQLVPMNLGGGDLGCSLSNGGVVDGNVLIWDDGALPDLTNAFRNIPKITGTLAVIGKAGGGGIKNLAWLQNLWSVGSILIHNLDHIANLEGLEGLSAVDGELILNLNDKLASLKGLDNVKTIGGALTLSSNMNLVSVEGLQGLTSIGGDFTVKGNGRLMDVLALISLTHVGGKILFVNNGDSHLETPVALRGATYASGSDGARESGSRSQGREPGAHDGRDTDGSVTVLYGGDTPTLGSLEKLVATFMPPLSSFSMKAYNTRLIQLSSEEARTLSRIGGHLVIFDDGHIGSQLQSLTSLSYVEGQVIIVGSQNSALESLTGLEPLADVGGLAIIAMKHLVNAQGLSGLSNLRGSMIIQFNSRLESFSGLGPLKRIRSELFVEENPKLTSLTGLEGVEDVGYHVSLLNLHMLQDLEGLKNLKSVHGELQIKECVKLTSTAGLQSLSKVGRSLSLISNLDLSDLSGFRGLTEIPSDLSVNNCPKLSSLESFNGIGSVGYSLIISSNEGLQSLNGLQGLKTVGMSVSINDNPSLGNLDGLSSLNSIGLDLFIRHNSRLNSLYALDRSLQKIGANGHGSLFVEDNGNLNSLGEMPTTVQSISGFVRVRGDNGISESEIQRLAAKAAKGSSIPASSASSTTEASKR